MTERGAGALRLATSPDVLEAELAGEAVLLHLGTKRYFQLNSTGAVIWAGVRDGLPRADVVARLVTEFDAPPDEAERELDRLLDELRERGLVVPRDAARP